MNAEPWDFRKCLAASAVLHALFFLIAHGFPAFNLPPPVEVEITSPFLGTGPAHLGAPKPLVPKAKGIPLPIEPNKPVEPVKPPEPQKDWVTPTADVKKAEKPPENVATPGGEVGGTGTSPLTGGSGAGANYGTPNGTGDGGAPLTVMPRLLNLDELLANLRKYYPEVERRAGHEGDVLLKVHIGADGLVGASDVIAADSPLFGAAAQKVALLMRFSPAMKASGPVPVSIKVPINFRLKD